MRQTRPRSSLSKKSRSQYHWHYAVTKQKCTGTKRGKMQKEGMKKPENSLLKTALTGRTPIQCLERTKATVSKATPRYRRAHDLQIAKKKAKPSREFMQRGKPLAFPGMRLASQQESHRSVRAWVECNGLSNASQRHKLGEDRGKRTGGWASWTRWW